MKTFSFRVLLSVTFCIALFSCSDDDDKKNSNEFTIGGVTVPILEGLSYVYETENSNGNTVYDWHIELQGDNGEKAGQVEFSLFHSDGSSLTAGTYTYDANALRNAFTFHTVFADTYVVETGEEALYEQDVKSGTIKVEKSGETYTFTIDVVLEGDIAIKGYYKGTLIPD